MPPIDGAGVADAIHLFEELLKSHPDSTAAHFTLLPTFTQMRSAIAKRRMNTSKVTRRNPADMVGATRASEGACECIRIH